MLRPPPLVDVPQSSTTRALLNPPPFQAFVHMLAEARERRARRSLLLQAQEAIGALEEAAYAKREAWHAWNPQRRAAQELQRAIEAGTLTYLVSSGRRPANACSGALAACCSTLCTSYSMHSDTPHAPFSANPAFLPH